MAGDFTGKCHTLKAALNDVAPKVVEAASESMDLLDESLSIFCGGDCSICPVELARQGVRVTLDKVGSTVLAVTDWCDSMCFLLKSDQEA